MSTDALMIGPAKIFVATAGSTVSASDIAALKAGTSLPSGWTYLGDTTAATTITDAPEYARATSQQTARTLDVAVTSIATTIGSTARRATVKLIEDFARATATDSGTDNVFTVNPSGLGSTPKFAVAILGPWPAGDLLFVAPRCTFVGSRELAIASDAYTEVGFEIEVLETTTSGYTGGYRIIVDLPNDPA